LARVADVVLLDHPADATGPRSINCYLTEVQDFAAAAPSGEGKKFKIDPQRLVYSLQATQRHAASRGRPRRRRPQARRRSPLYRHDRRRDTNRQRRLGGRAGRQ
jgi:hypothetical protein